MINGQSSHQSRQDEVNPLLIFAASVLVSISLACGANRYVDAAAPAGGNGQSWETAWQNPEQATGLAGGDVVYIAGGTYVVNDWNVPDGAENNPIVFTWGRGGQVVFDCAGGFVILGGLRWVTFDFYIDGIQKLKLTGAARSGLFIYDDNSSVGFTINGADFTSAGVRMYDSRKTHIGWCTFNSSGVKRTGGPGWIVGVGRWDLTGWGNNSLHDSTLNLFYLHGVDANGNNGDDGMQNLGAMDIYNNKFISRLTTGFAGANHQDGIQTDGFYFRIWNNYFENLANYTIFGQFWSPGYGTWQIWNNVFNMSDPVLTSQPSAHIILGYKDGPNTPRDIFIFNNLVRGGGRNIDVGKAGYISTATNVWIVNNLRFGGGPILFDGVGATVSNNTDANASYFVNAAANDFHLTSQAVNAIDRGMTNADLQDISTTDKDGAARIVPWDIGPYEFGGTVPSPTPSPTPPSPTPSPTPIPTVTPMPTPTPIPTPTPPIPTPSPGIIKGYFEGNLDGIFIPQP
jgi:hypothetical protein